MAIHNIDPKATKEDEHTQGQMKPLVAKFGRKNPKIYQEFHKVISGKVSSSGEWCILETEEYAVLMNMNTSAMKELFRNILPALSGKYANALVIQPNKKAKCGAIVAVDDEEKVWYTYDSENETFETDLENPDLSVKKSSDLNLSMFLDTNVPTDLANTTRKVVSREQKSAKRKDVVETEE